MTKTIDWLIIFVKWSLEGNGRMDDINWYLASDCVAELHNMAYLVLFGIMLLLNVRMD